MNAFGVRMVNIKPPVSPVDKLGLWPPKNSRQYVLKLGDNWWSVAEAHNMDPWDLINFNFKTRVPEEVNYYMRELIGAGSPVLTATTIRL
jgi:hypothetical protein